MAMDSQNIRQSYRGRGDMSNRTMLEINHDFTPHGEKQLLKWANDMLYYLSSGDPELLPPGVTWFGMRHHTEDCPMGDPPKGWNNIS